MSPMTEPTPSEPVSTGPQGVVTTRLVHRAARGPQEWWRSAAVYVNEPPLLSSVSTLDDVAHRAEQLRLVSRLGVQAVRIGCPPLPHETSEDVVVAVERLLTRTRRTGLRVILRIDPHDPRDEACARYWLSRGADGVDLGPVSDEHPVSHARYRELHALLFEHARGDDPILSTRLTPSAQGRAEEMLHEDWLHHLVDADLLHATSPAQVVESVTQSLRIRDALGTTGAWLVPDVTEAGSPQLARAGALIVLAMPGAVYLRQGTELGMPVKTSSERAPERLAEADRLREEQRGVSGSSYELFRAALRLRADHRLGLSPLAWVEDIAGPVPEHVLAFLSGEMLVVTNLGTEEFALPPEVEVLLSSGPLSSGSGGVQVLPPDTTAWLWLEPQEPQRDPRARR